jgi:hypothetical protein
MAVTRELPYTTQTAAFLVALRNCPSLGRMYAVRGPYSKAVGQCPKTGGFASSPQTMCLPGSRSSSGLSDTERNEEVPRSDQRNIRPPALTFSTFSATEPHAQKIRSIMHGWIA